MTNNPWLRKFYRSREWTNFRMMLISQRGPICSDCGRLVSNSIELIGHHEVELTPENVHDYSISLNPEKVKLICRDCHDKRHMRFGYVNQGRQVFFVYGPPLSGKTMYVQQNKSHQDIVVDINVLFSAVTGLPEYDKPDALLPIVRQVQRQLLDHVRTRFGKWHNAWIVGGYADKYQREQVIANTGAEPVYMDATMDECLARLRTDSRLVYRQSEYEDYIRKWFEQYRP
jgi:hypothetical protein